MMNVELNMLYNDKKVNNTGGKYSEGNSLLLQHVKLRGGGTAPQTEIDHVMCAISNLKKLFFFKTQNKKRKKKKTRLS